jgi:hypothetical protein
MYPMISHDAMSSVIEVACYVSTVFAAMLAYLQTARF